MKLSEELALREDLASPGLSACTGCSVELTMRMVLRVLGPNTVLAIPPGCMGGVGTVGLGATTGAKIPVFHPLLTNIASMLSGLKLYYDHVGREVQIVAFAGDGGTVDAGLQCLSAAAERGARIIYICYDNEGYMNTGFQRSGSTTKGAWTSTTPVGKVIKGKQQHKKDMPMIMAMHDIPYVATASPAYMGDLVGKVQKAMSVRNGLAYLHILTPCRNGWGFPPERSIQVARLSVQTRFWPLYEVEEGSFRLTHDVPRPRPLRDFVQGIKRFQHLREQDLEELEDLVERKWERLKLLANKE